MTGPEHFREAERLLAETEGAIRDGVKSSAHLQVALEMAPTSIAAAQAHATLALVAATAAAMATAYDGDETGSRAREWGGVA